jgi:hypothetical protein
VSKFDVAMKLNLEDSKLNVEYQWLTSSMKNNKLSHSFLQLLYFHCIYTKPLTKQIEGIHVTGLTEYSYKKMTIRAHPCYKNETPWFDWVMIAWNIPYVEYLSSKLNDDSPDYIELSNIEESTDNEKSTAMLIPAKIICIIQEEQNEAYAIIHSCFQVCKKVSVLSYCWQMEYENAQASRASNAQYVIMDSSIDLTPIYHKVSIDNIQ